MQNLIAFFRNKKKLVNLVLILLSLGLRISMFPYVNNDMTWIVIPWYDYLIENGGLPAINGLIYGSSYFHPYAYSPPYLYLLSMAIPLTRFLTPLVVIKLISVLFDYIIAFFALKVVETRHPIGESKWCIFHLVTFAPTVFVTSAYWGQFDCIYMAFLMASLYYLLKEKYKVGVVLQGCALAFKVHAIVFLPVLLILAWKKRYHWGWLLTIPAAYLGWMLPAFFVGYPLNGMLSTFYEESKAFSALTVNAPSIFAFLPADSPVWFGHLGIFLTTIVFMLLFWMAIRGRMTDDRAMIFFIALFSLAMPYFLPHMHERYFYPAALFGLVIPFYDRKYLAAPLVLQCTTLLSYTHFLRGYEIVPLAIPAAINGFLLVWLLFGVNPPSITPANHGAR